ncbi:MAG: type II toxin-antitoxin system RelE/ParE family toxin [Planctomycetes bacterium]|nr:type II toxin-antitoxin system RelE/ParE family toxin [Planctomycetota bacterium]
MDFEIRYGKLRLLRDGHGDNNYPPGIGKLFRRRLQTIDAAPDERTFYQLQSLHYEKLKGDRSHQKSMRLNKKYRLILEIEDRDEGNKVHVIDIEDYH